MRGQWQSLQSARSGSITLRTLFAATAIVMVSGATPQSCSAAPLTVPSYTLTQKWQQSPDSWLLRFALPSDRKYLGNDPTLPTCISVHHNDTTSDTSKMLKKSYSPVSHPSTVGFFDLLVKAYPLRPGGGVGASICALQPGQALMGTLKAERLVHGSPVVSNRWKNVGMVAGGTGIAPLLQIVRILLEDPHDTTTRIQLLSVNRYEEDILMKEELDRYAREFPDRFAVTYSLTGDKLPNDWNGCTGRGSVDMARRALPPPSGDGTMIFVCGTDGFRDMWAGPVVRGPPQEDGSKGPKIQGPLLGLLRDAGYDASQVFKY